MQLAMDTYKIVEDEMVSILNSASTSWMGPNSKLASLGGIMINIDGADDVFLPIKFQVVDQSGNGEDLLDKTFVAEEEPEPETPEKPTDVLEQEMRLRLKAT